MRIFLLLPPSSQSCTVTMIDSSLPVDCCLPDCSCEAFHMQTKHGGYRITIIRVATHHRHASKVADDAWSRDNRNHLPIDGRSDVQSDGSALDIDTTWRSETSKSVAVDLKYEGKKKKLPVAIILPPESITNSVLMSVTLPETVTTTIRRRNVRNSRRTGWRWRWR
jgi:hypothetical protein